MDFEFLLIPGGAFLAALAVGVAGFGDALIAAALWLLVLSPAEAVPLVVSTGLVIHIIPLVRLRRALEYTRLGPFLIGGTLGVPVGSWLLGTVNPEASACRGLWRRGPNSTSMTCFGTADDKAQDREVS